MKSCIQVTKKIVNHERHTGNCRVLLRVRGSRPFQTNEYLNADRGKHSGLTTRVGDSVRGVGVQGTAGHQGVWQLQFRVSPLGSLVPDTCPDTCPVLEVSTARPSRPEKETPWGSLNKCPNSDNHFLIPGTYGRHLYGKRRVLFYSAKDVITLEILRKGAYSGPSRGP